MLNKKEIKDKVKEYNKNKVEFSFIKNPDSEFISELKFEGRPADFIIAFCGCLNMMYRETGFNLTIIKVLHQSIGSFIELKENENESK